MLINGIKATNYSASEDNLLMQLSCTADEALEMDTTSIKVTTDDGDLVEQFSGYLKVSATVDAITKDVTLKCILDTSNIGAISSSLSKRIDEVDSNVKAMSSSLDILLGESISVIPE